MVLRSYSYDVISHSNARAAAVTAFTISILLFDVLGGIVAVNGLCTLACH